MQPERQISVACALIGGALIYPGAVALLHHPESVAGGSYLAGGLIGTLGVAFGSLLAFDFGGGMAILFGGLWGLVALALAGALGLAAWHEPGLVWRSVFTLAALLPLLIYGLIAWRMLRPERPGPGA